MTLISNYQAYLHYIEVLYLAPLFRSDSSANRQLKSRNNATCGYSHSYLFKLSEIAPHLGLLVLAWLMPTHSCPR